MFPIDFYGLIVIYVISLPLAVWFAGMIYYVATRVTKEQIYRLTEKERLEKYIQANTATKGIVMNIEAKEL